MKNWSMYPLVQCKGHHGDPLPGYAVCVHALEDPLAQIARPIDRPTKTEVGLVVCTECDRQEHLPMDKLEIVCAHFVSERFGVPL